MGAERLGTVIEQIRRAGLLAEAAGATDGQLLRAYLSCRDEVAFELLVRRHGPMVLGVCRRVIGNLHDAEDAFQATFLVLTRRAGAVTPPEAVGNWLYGVAYRTALKARAAAARRRSKEGRMADVPHPVAPPEQGLGDLWPLLDRELSRLPERFRLPVVLCDLQGRTRRDAARQLNVPDGTLSNRLATARRLLSQRLARCGLVLPAGVLVALLSQSAASAAVPAPLFLVTVGAGAFSPTVIALTEGVLTSMWLTKLKLATAVLALVVAAAALGVGIWHAEAGGRPSKQHQERQASDDEPEPRKLAEKESKLFQGTWYLVGGASRGEKESPDKDLDEVIRGNAWQKLAIDGDKFGWGSVLKEDAMSGTVKIDPNKKPKTLDFTFERDGKTVTALCIYELDGDRLRICYAEGTRPKKFATSGDTEWPRLYTWKRTKR